jgi:capsular polysaccharide biosynthesis protein
MQKIKFWHRIAGKVDRLIRPSDPAICQDVAIWARGRGLPVQHLAGPLYQEIRSFFSNEEMAAAMVDTHRKVLSRPQNLVSIEKARVRETLGLVELPDGRVLLEGNWWEPLLRQHPTYRKRIGFLKHKLSGDVFSLLAMWSTSFYHWLHDVLPRLEAAWPYLPAGTKFLINENPTRWQLDTLGAYGIFERDLEIQPSNSRTEIERLWFATPAGQTGFGSRDLLKKVSSRLRKYFKTKSHKNRGGLFVSRAKARSRRLINDAEVVAILEKYEFTNVFCEDLTISEQIEFFWNASCVIAPHGAGLTNIIFCNAGGLVCELQFAQKLYTNHYWMLAQQFDLFYSRLEARKVDLANGEYDLEANLGDIENWLNANPRIANS